jgi:hypothetical protein
MTLARIVIARHLAALRCVCPAVKRVVMAVVVRAAVRGRVVAVRPLVM